MSISEWRKLPISLTEICLDTTLRCGQTFRWKTLNNEWSCALHGRVVSLKQDSTHLYYRTIWADKATKDRSSPIRSTKDETPDKDDTLMLLQNYLNLTPNLKILYEQWSSADPNFKKRAPKFSGLRILRQDAWETLIGFICSSNNNIPRISQMVSNLCLHYGPLVGHIGDQAFHDFPSPKALSGDEVESHLRKLGFGYRAGFIAKTALIVAQEKPKDWLQGLCNPENFNQKSSLNLLETGGREGYRYAHSQLLQLRGVGPKVADCVCLMGLGWREAIPVDTHVWQIAQRDYNFGKGKFKTLNKATYDAIGDHFRQLWGIEAGWAHSVLFAADLKRFSDRVVDKGSEIDAERAIVEEINDGITLKRKLDSETIDSEDVAQSNKSKTVTRPSRKNLKKLKS
ncbi:hypothetical protein K3495_g1290 [Podosphaera aphanis]|nr:hypothetical protein K3495_g1290 [Podosphaera aphanis]